MSDFLAAILLGLVEGLTEFIPVSSTGHLLLTKVALGLTDPSWDSFIVLIQLGAILAVVALYFRRLWAVLIGLPTDPAARRFALSVLVAFMPAVFLGFLLYDFIKQVLFESPALICWSLILGGFVLLAIDRWSPAPKEHDAMKLPLLTSLGIGVIQCISMIPGVSRSGATIMGALAMGIERRTAAEFSFFLAVPTMMGATTLELWDSRAELLAGAGPVGWSEIAVGFVVSFIVALFVIRAFVAFVSKSGFGPFAWYRIVAGAVAVVLLSNVI